jgi:hypothetical protein
MGKYVKLVKFQKRGDMGHQVMVRRLFGNKLFKKPK